ncbi:MAG: glycine C-acetyltransferase [Planctomycetes bacterium]|nr:glycine C-acetyltransferase [Planctomycetota bacterium]MBI3847663.1 glycine C-acetyltransferase [Planctomycetota bacterium]
MSSLLEFVEKELVGLREARTLKVENVLEGPQGPTVRVNGREVVMLTSNNYLGLSSHPRIVEAAHEGIRRFGNGLSSVRFICGTQTIHKDLEKKISSFLGTEDSILYLSCFAANEGLFAGLLGEEDAVYTDALNHASIIDGVRLCKAKRQIYAHNDLADLDKKLREDATSVRNKLVITDGVFSMEGELAPLPKLIEITKRHGATLAVDDSHGTGCLGKTGRGTAEELGVLGQIDVFTGTLGKALGGAAGGFISGRAPIITYLRQKSRPYLFSNSLPPAICAASIEAIKILEENPQLVATLRENTRYFREGLKKLGFAAHDGIHPIIPIIVGDTALAIALSKDLLEAGCYVTGFGFPVVPQGQARLRVQISAAHTRAHLDRALEAFKQVGKKHGIVK